MTTNRPEKNLANGAPPETLSDALSDAPAKAAPKDPKECFFDAVVSVFIVSLLFALLPSEIATAVGAGSVGVSAVGRSIASVGTGSDVRPSERAYREDILLLTLQGAQNMDAVLERLRQAPRAEIVAILRDDLNSSPVSAPLSVLKAAVLLRAIELTPQLKILAQRTEEWTVFAHINALVSGESAIEKEFASVYLQRLPVLLSPAAKVAVLEGLTSFKVAVSDGAFTELLNASSYDIRISAVQNFLVTHAELKTAERQRRMVLALDVRPMQARLLALKTVPRLPASERSQLKPLFSGDRCERESDRKLRSACKNASASLGSKRGGQ